MSQKKSQQSETRGQDGEKTKLWVLATISTNTPRRIHRLHIVVSVLALLHAVTRSLAASECLY